MPEVNRDQGVQLGCGTLIIIALIVMFFSQGDADKVEREVRSLRSEIGGLKKVEREVRSLRSEIGGLREWSSRQSTEIRNLRESLSPPIPGASPEKGAE